MSLLSFGTWISYQIIILPFWVKYFTFQDIAIFSDNITKCKEDIKESQNNQPKFQCVPAFNKKVDHLLPLTEEECDVSIKETTAATFLLNRYF